MSLKQQIEQDLKQALLAKDVTKTSTLKMVKSAILNEEIASGKRDSGLDDTAIEQLLKKELKKRTEAAELYQKAGSPERADQERSEAEVIKQYLPEPMNEVELMTIIDTVLAQYDEVAPALMGKIIGQVRSQTEGRADGGDIARLVKAKLT
jgi:uncharacterized protein YqeY